MKKSKTQYMVKSAWAALLAASMAASAVAQNNAVTQEDNPVIRNRNASSFDRPPSKIYPGRSPFNAPAEEIVAAAPKPKPAAPKPAALPAAPPAKGAYAETGCGWVKLSKRAPAQVSVGDEFTYELVATAECDVANVLIVEKLPAEAKFVSSDPPGAAEGQKLSWIIPAMRRGETKTLKVTLKAEKEGELVNCATVTAVPEVCVSTFVGKASLVLKKTAVKENVGLGETAAFNIEVSNTGSAVARNVVVTDPVPEGFEAEGGRKELTFEVGALEPGQSRVIPVSFKAGQRGRICNVATATSANAGKADAEACVAVLKTEVKLYKTTDNKELFINKRAAYALVITNTGDTDLAGMTLTDTAPEGTRVLAAPDGVINGNTVTWTGVSLGKGASKAYEVVLTSPMPGNKCNVATLTTPAGEKLTAQACTDWKGVNAILIEMVDDPDPLQVGETTTFTIRVTNQGGTTPLNEVGVTCILPSEIDPVSASNGGKIEGKKVTWPAVPEIGTKAFITYTVLGKALAVGDARTEIQVTTSQRTKPINKFESTTIY